MVKMSSSSEGLVPFVSHEIMAIQGTLVGGWLRSVSSKWRRTPCAHGRGGSARGSFAVLAVGRRRTLENLVHGTMVEMLV